MAPVSFNSPTATFDSRPTGEFLENNPKIPQTPPLPADNDRSLFQDLYDFAVSIVDKDIIHGILSDLVNEGVLDPVDAATLAGLISAPPNSPQELADRLPELKPAEISRIVDKLKYIEFSYENVGRIDGVGEIGKVTVHKDNDKEESITEINNTKIYFSAEPENKPTADVSDAAGALDKLTITRKENGASLTRGERLRLTVAETNPIQIKAAEFEVQNFPAEPDGSPSDAFDIAARDFSASGTHEETDANWKLFVGQVNGEIRSAEQKGTTRGVEFELSKDEHQAGVSIDNIDLVSDADGTQVNFSGVADEPALTAVYRNEQDDNFETVLTVDQGSGSIAYPLNAPLLDRSAFSETDIQQAPFIFNFQNIGLQTKFALLTLSELSGQKTENGYREIFGRGLQVVGNGSEWSGNIGEFSYVGDDNNFTLNASNLLGNYRQDIYGSLGAFNFQRNPESMSVNLHNLGLRAWDAGLSLQYFYARYATPADNWHMSASGLAARYGDYGGLFLSDLNASYDSAARKINFTLANGVIRGFIDLDKPLPPFPQDSTPEAWQDYLSLLAENNITYTGSVNNLGQFLSQNVYISNSQHQRALSAMLPYFDDVAFRFDNKLIEHFTDDDMGANTLVWLNEYTDGFVGQQVNQFVGAYLSLARNTYLQQHGRDLPEEYYRRFDLTDLLAEGQGTQVLTVAADPRHNSASVVLDYALPFHLGGLSYGYTYKPDSAPDLSVLGVNFFAEHTLNSRVSFGPEILRLNIDTALAVGRWSLGKESSNSLLGLMDKYELASWPVDDDKWFIKPLLDLPALPFVSASFSSQIPLPLDTHIGLDVAWQGPRLENLGHERSLLENISWDNFLASLSLSREVAKGFSFKAEVLLQANNLFSPERSAQLVKGSILAKISK